MPDLNVTDRYLRQCDALAEFLGGWMLLGLVVAGLWGTMILLSVVHILVWWIL